MDSEYCEKIFHGTLRELHALFTKFKSDFQGRQIASGCQLEINDIYDKNFSMEISCPTDRDDDIPAFLWITARVIPLGVKVIFTNEMFDYLGSPDLQAIYELLTASVKLESPKH